MLGNKYGEITFDNFPASKRITQQNICIYYQWFYQKGTNLDHFTNISYEKFYTCYVIGIQRPGKVVGPLRPYFFHLTMKRIKGRMFFQAVFYF